MSAVWLTIILVAVASAAIKAAGPLLLGDRQLGPRATVVVAALAPALPSALVLVDTITAGRRLVVDARLAGVAAAGIALLLRAPMLLVLAVAIATTALVRFLVAERLPIDSHCRKSPLRCSPATWATRGLHSAEPPAVRDFLE
ncbi:MAG TPA: AzlD domain-containing protein [Propionibacteriaceae bacterium]|nr:AzlD domain-containing protein [Propionibacteriaceae bacterium]